MLETEQNFKLIIYNSYHEPFYDMLREQSKRIGKICAGNIFRDNFRVSEETAAGGTMEKKTVDRKMKRSEQLRRRRENLMLSKIDAKSLHQYENADYGKVSYFI